MHPLKITPKVTTVTDLKTKIIQSYPIPTKDFSVTYMKITGRHPEGPGTFTNEHVCQFVIYIVKGSGKVLFKDSEMNVSVGDVVYVPAETLFATTGKFEYFEVSVPGFYPEQLEEIVI